MVSGISCPLLPALNCETSRTEFIYHDEINVNDFSVDDSGFKIHKAKYL